MQITILMRIILIFLLIYLLPTQFIAQQVECLAFYNVENLFDTEDDPDINDEEYLPSSGWTEQRYKDKLDRMAEVIAQLGMDYNLNGPAFIGLSEVENQGVIADLIAHPLLADRGYQILHFNSPDRRGIDVAAIYIKERFTPIQIKPFPLIIHNKDGERKFTRDILFVKGMLDGEIINITVNHWPSRWGGQKVSGPYRQKAGSVNRQILDSLRRTDEKSKLIVMGDLNDNPNDKSLKKNLNAKKSLDIRSESMYNPFCKFYSKGMGSNAWRDTWSNFDQIILSSSFDETNEGWTYKRAKIFKKQFMLQSSGRYKGYPLRTQAGGQYMGGYSDHFPVLVYLNR